MATPSARKKLPMRVKTSPPSPNEGSRLPGAAAAMRVIITSRRQHVVRRTVMTRTPLWRGATPARFVPGAASRPQEESTATVDPDTVAGDRRTGLPRARSQAAGADGYPPHREDARALDREVPIG